MKKFIVKLLIGLKNIIYPPTCLICKQGLAKTRPDELVCVKCREGIKKNAPPFCRRCGRNLGKINSAVNICPACLKNQAHFDRAFAPCVYEGAIKDLIHEFKYNNRDYLAGILSALMVDFIREYDIPISSLDLIIPIPLHPARLREREFNQAELLARKIASAYSKPVSSDNLVRRRHTRTQTDLQSSERLTNVKDSFALRFPELVKGKNILLVDDVMTTGATSSEASRALKNAGACTVFVLTLAN
jgi:competence protein ComFC